MSYYNNYFPINYQNPYLQQQQQAAMQQQLQQMQTQQPTQQAINSGYVTVRSEEEARNYPVAPGASVTFFNETAPYCYKKTMGSSPLDRPDFHIYEIIEKQTPTKTQNLPQNNGNSQEPNNNTSETEKQQIGAIFGEISILKQQVKELQDVYNTLTAKKESGKDVKSIDKQAE